MSDTEISKDGVFVDLKTGSVVEGAPEEGVQLIPPGSEITPDMRKAVEAARDAAAGVSNVGTIGVRDEPKSDRVVTEPDAEDEAPTPKSKRDK